MDAAVTDEVVGGMGVVSATDIFPRQDSGRSSFLDRVEAEEESDERE
jgi:hypothetical protein